MIRIICKNKIFTDIEAIFFDKDGTIEDSRNYLCQLANERIRLLSVHQLGMVECLPKVFGFEAGKIDPKGLMAVGSRQDNELAAATLISSSGCGWYKAREIAHQAFEEATKNISLNKQSSPIFPGTLSILQSLAKVQCKLGIISADSLLGIKRFVSQEKLESYFQILLGSDLNLQKPNPELYLKACKSLNISPQRTLMVGDSVGDVLMAQQAGAAGTIGIIRDQPSIEYLWQADVTITHLEDIKILS